MAYVNLRGAGFGPITFTRVHFARRTIATQVAVLLMEAGQGVLEANRWAFCVFSCGAFYGQKHVHGQDHTMSEAAIGFRVHAEPTPNQNQQ